MSGNVIGEREQPEDKEDKGEKEQPVAKEEKGDRKKRAPRVKRTARDSVFTFLFRDPAYILELYRALHPEDTTVTEADCRVVTLENVLINGWYNDLGLMVRDTLLILAEAQTQFSRNITLRLFLYLAETFRRLIDDGGWDLHGSRPVKLPRVELVVLYAGGGEDIPETLKLSELCAEAGKSSVELEVRVLRFRGKRDIIDQYIRFCEIVGEKVKEHGRTQEALDGIVTACIAEGILVPFLRSREKEVRSIMYTLFSEEHAQKLHDRAIREETWREAKEETEKADFLSLIKKMSKEGFGLPLMIRMTDRSAEEVIAGLASLGLPVPQ